MGQNMLLLAPMVNIVRVPEGSRNFETFKKIRNLTAQLASAETRHSESGVMVEVKHYAAKNNFR